jgi:hypothetical protein
VRCTRARVCELFHRRICYGDHLSHLLWRSFVVLTLTRSVTHKHTLSPPPTMRRCIAMRKWAVERRKFLQDGVMRNMIVAMKRGCERKFIANHRRGDLCRERTLTNRVVGIIIAKLSNDISKTCRKGGRIAVCCMSWCNNKQTLRLYEMGMHYTHDIVTACTS